MKSVGGLALALLLLVVAFAMFRTARLRTRQLAPGHPAQVSIDPNLAAARLGGAIRFETVTLAQGIGDAEAFDRFVQYLGDTFPHVRSTLTREPIGAHALLYTWTGTDRARPPLLLLGHLDVVPAADAAAWTHPPFSGAIADGRIWGRGALDDKSCVMGLLEAVDALAASGFTPARTIYLAFGDDEETNGTGADAITARLASRGVKNATVLDEGGFIYTGLPGITQQIAFVGLTEKRAMDVELRVTTPGGHASMPPAETAVGILARALARVEAAKMPARLDGAALAMFETLAPEMPWTRRAIFANLWLTRPLVLRQLAQKPETNALVRTTIAPTQLEGSDADNVLASSARAMLNIRLLPGDEADAVTSHLTRAIDDARVHVRVVFAKTGAPMSSTDTNDFRNLARAIRAVHPEVLVSPFLTMAATDARRYAAIAPDAYRILPIDTDGALDSIHGANERIRVDAYASAIRTYATILEALAK